MINSSDLTNAVFSDIAVCLLFNLFRNSRHLFLLVTKKNPTIFAFIDYFLKSTEQAIERLCRCRIIVLDSILCHILLPPALKWWK